MTVPGGLDTGSEDQSVADRLVDLERRVAALEGGGPAPSDQGAPEAGAVRYSGEVHLHGDVAWSIALDVRATLDLADEPRVVVLAALGHPARARIVRHLLADGPRSTAALLEATGLASAGQLYHHLRSLTHSGLVEQDGRGSYRVGPRAAVPALVLLAAAADVAGQLR